ncbi:MAG: putative PEP-binding protein [Microthrixaceae bacterium]
MRSVVFGSGIVIGLATRLDRWGRKSQEMGQPVVALSESLDDVVAREFGPEVVGILVGETVSAYSHDASRVWRLGIPTLCGVDDLLSREGRILEVDLDRARVSVAGTDRGMLPDVKEATQRGERDQVRLVVRAELEQPSDLVACSAADGIAILDADDSLRLDPVDARELTAEVERRWGDPVAIRFFDRDPIGRTVDSLAAACGVRLLDSKSVVGAFHQLVESLDLLRAPWLVLPMVTEADDLRRFRTLTRSLGGGWGATIECPAAAILANEILAECDLVEVGLNDLTQFTVAWSRDVPHDRLLPTRRLARPFQHFLRWWRARGRWLAFPSRWVSTHPADRGRLLYEVVSLGIGSVSCPAPLVVAWTRVQ